MILIQTRNLIDFIPLLQELEFGDKFSLSMLHWCGIGNRSYPLAFWEVYIAMYEEETVGIIGLYQQVETPLSIVWIGWFGVRPSFRRRGFGTMMIDILKQKARDYNFKQLWVFTEEENEVALNFYEKVGFKILSDADKNNAGTTHDPTDVVLRTEL
jgi:ribosomal protein S18 acetylase RimI-like enzyme